MTLSPTTRLRALEAARGLPVRAEAAGVVASSCDRRGTVPPGCSAIATGAARRGRRSHFHAPLYLSAAVLRTKHTGGVRLIPPPVR